MTVQFAALASGSRGNAALVRTGGAGVLIDVGIGPRALSHRLSAVGSGWGMIAGALLTHTHGDHVGDATLRYLARRRIPLICHEGHAERLGHLAGFRLLAGAGLVRPYDERPFLTPTGMRVEPIAVSHDGGPTFGFRVEVCPGRRGGSVSVGYVSDAGCWDDRHADALAGVDLLGLEFNHDVALQLGSGRSRALIRRNLGPLGHLSNEQGAGLLAAVFDRSGSAGPRHVVLLHLSEDCNRPELAYGLALETAGRCGRRVAIHLARQWSASADVRLTPRRRRRAVTAREVGFPWEAA